jgi:hypothetical protein
MPSPFPGMNPYLEDPDLWPSVHFDLIGTVRDALLSQLPARYYVRVELRMFDASPAEAGLLAIGDVTVTRRSRPGNGSDGQVHADALTGREQAGQEGRPGVMIAELPPRVEVRERALHIHSRDNRELVTVIEVLSPTNKRPGKGRQQYEEKRIAIAGARVSLVEIDLLREGEPLPLWRQGAPLPRDLAGDYRAFVVRAPRWGGELFIRSVREPLPIVPVPLLPGDGELGLDLQQIIHTVYDHARLEDEVDYHQEPIPPLSPEDAAWADQLLRERGLR